jgi:Mn-dependent DtxR family transcriptional regulator
MPDQQPTTDLIEQARSSEREILYLLSDPEDNQPLWSVEDLAREMENPCVSDSLNALHRAGLIHRTSDGFVFASRAAVRYLKIVGPTV